MWYPQQQLEKNEVLSSNIATEMRMMRWMGDNMKKELDISIIPKVLPTLCYAFIPQIYR